MAVEEILLCCCFCFSAVFICLFALTFIFWNKVLLHLQLASNSPYSCFCLPNAGITGVHHHAPLGNISLYQWAFFSWNNVRMWEFSILQRNCPSYKGISFLQGKNGLSIQCFEKNLQLLWQSSCINLSVGFSCIQFLNFECEKCQDDGF
jgi:hypothetical protein